MSLYPFAVGTVPGVDRQRAPYASAGISVKDLPDGFPYYLWYEQTQRYYDYWRWYNGDALNELNPKPKNGGTPGERYPLKVNPIRNFSHKHAAVLLGEDRFDSPAPAIRTIATPLLALDGSGYNEADKRLAATSQNVVNEVWAQSGGRGIQVQNAIMSQFLGGCAYQLSYEPWRENLRIPIRVKPIVPDFFLPIFEAGNPWDLLEGYVVYRVPAIAAHRQYNIKGPIPTTGYNIYVEHWTRESYSIYLDREPLTSRVGNKTITYDNVENPFGFVPLTYIPHIRTGNDYGESLVEDVRGLTKELNARAADKGDLLRGASQRKFVGTDIAKSVDPISFNGGDFYAYNIGFTNPVTKATPTITAIDPPAIPEAIASMTDEVWGHALRVGNMGGIAFGEDEGSQRSSLTLAFRMWPTTAHIGQERAFWNDGLSQMARQILRMVNTTQASIKAVKIPDDWEHRIQVSQQFQPAVPRDREQEVNEIILRFQSGLISPETALSKLGDIEYIEEEISKIREWMSYQASLEVKAKGAQTSLKSPVAADGMDEKQ